MVVVSRPKNGCSLNGREYLLGNKCQVILFKDEEEAKEVLASEGIFDKEIEDMGIEFIPWEEVK